MVGNEARYLIEIYSFIYIHTNTYKHHITFSYVSERLKTITFSSYKSYEKRDDCLNAFSERKINSVYVYIYIE